MKLLNIKSTSALFLFVTFWLSLLPLSAYALNDIVKLDRIVTIVDKNAITEQELEAKVRTVSDQLTKQGKQLPQERILRKQILERLIVDSIQLQLAAERGIKVNEIQLEKTIERIAEQNQMSVETFKTALANDGVSYNAFREDMRNEITIARLKESEINNRINISEGEVDNYLTTQENSKDGKQEEFELSQILIRTPEESSPQDIEAAQIKVEEVLAELNKGESFEKVSASFSDAPNALEGGNMGWRSSSQIPPVFLALLKEMSVGQASKPIRSPNGFHIIKINNKRSADSTLIVEQTHARHILTKLNEVVSEQEAKQKMDGLKERLDNGADFVELAQQYSEDGSANSGGDLGWVNPGDTVPEFETAMNSLAPEEISEPIRSPFGWHIIQVLERRKQDMTDQAARIQARKEIFSRKVEEAYEDWIHELRDRAFVELRLEDNFY
ncbi:MAG: peptidylprolyl isomerase [Methylophilaceae bacterium]|jgi:peptidyl-prolyl cis-trans isomerase SurA|nr:peptidylprolyl isomerase [Methylophilaceae bacterium]MDG1452908.1 peptidylprolyl isomerase [Methylophilaceae bacterium]